MINNILTPARQRQVDYYVEQGILVNKDGALRLNGVKVQDDPENFERCIYVRIGDKSTSLLIDREVHHKHSEPTIRDFSATLREAIDKICFYLGITCIPEEAKDFLIERFGKENYYRS